MNYCPNCGSNVQPGANVCTECGAQVPKFQPKSSPPPKSASYQSPPPPQSAQYQSPPPPQHDYQNYPRPYTANDPGGFGYSLLGFCFPLIGLILYLVWQDDKPNNAKAAGGGALASVLISIFFYLLVFAAAV